MGKSQLFLSTGARTDAISFTPYQGFHRFARFSRHRDANVAGHGAVQTWERPAMRKVRLADRASVRHLAAMETAMFSHHLAVLEHLALLQYEDGSPRKPGFLMMFTEGAQWKLVLKDNDADAQLPMIGRTADEAWGLLNEFLGCEEAPWEPNARRKAKGK
jgi:hypothetical protein